MKGKGGCMREGDGNGSARAGRWVDRVGTVLGRGPSGMEIMLKNEVE